MSGLTNFYGKIKCSDFSYNVEKTDSVVSPFTGVITFKADIPHDLYEAYYAFTCQFAEQDGKWIHKKIDIEYKAVSYTHLDVYKRQTWTLVNWMTPL